MFQNREISRLLLIQNLTKLILPQHTTALPAVSRVYLTRNLTWLPWVHLRAVQEAFLVQL